MGTWFRQILIEGLVLGLFVSGALVVPWPWLKALFIVAIAYILIFIPRNPTSFYRRMFHLVLGAMLLLPALRFAVTIAGFASSPWFSGFIDLTAGIGDAVPAWVWVSIAALCVLADLALYLRVERPQQAKAALMTPDPSDSTFRVGAEEVHVRTKLTLSNDSDQTVTVVGASLVLRLPIPVTVECMTHRLVPEVLIWLPVRAETPLTVPAKSGGRPGTGTVLITADLRQGFSRRWLVLRSRFFGELRGDVRLSATYDAWQVPKEIVFKFKG